jgi:hypothetical protein
LSSIENHWGRLPRFPPLPPMHTCQMPDWQKLWIGNTEDPTKRFFHYMRSQRALHFGISPFPWSKLSTASITKQVYTRLLLPIKLSLCILQAPGVINKLLDGFVWATQNKIG